MTAQNLLRYLYRDASNYKAYGEVLLAGALTSELEARLRRCLIDQAYFIPEKVGLPSLRERLYEYSDGSPTEDDHVLHELVELRAATAEEVDTGPCAGQLEEMVRGFEREALAGWWVGLDELLERLELEPYCPAGFEIPCSGLRALARDDNTRPAHTRARP